MANKVFICGIDTSKLPRATNQEMNELLQKIKKGDQEAKKQFILCNIRLVLSICGRFSTTKANIDDVFQVGTMGLLKSIDNFNLDFNVKFSTYAVPMIIGEIRRYLRDNSALKVTRSIRDTAYKALTAREEIQKETCDEPTIDEIAKRLNLPIQEVACALDAISDPVSIYDPVYNDDDGNFTFIDQLKDSTSEDSWIEQTSLKESLLSLNKREREIITLRYFVGKTQMEISNEIGISQAQVSRLEKNAIKILKEI